MIAPIIDRTQELARLTEAIERPPQLVVLRGRRRVGKSFLLVHALARHRGVFFQADEQTERAHLDLFATEVSTLLKPRVPLRFETWDEALETLGALAQEGPLAIVLDEFQWLQAAQPSLDSILQRHWDRWQRQGTPITLVLSGSALRLMERLLDPGAPLYGRADYRPLLLPLDFRDASRFAPRNLDAEQKLRRFAVLGGTPQYQVWAGEDSLEDLIAERVLSKGESLYEEPLHLLREEQEIRDPANYFAIVREIAAGRTRTGEISNATQLPTPNLAKMLSRLEALGYLEGRAPLGPNEPEAKRASYRLVDPFFRFWFRFVFPNRSLLERGRVKAVLQIVRRDMDTFMGKAFEDCCREWAGRYAGDALPASQHLGNWWSRDGQVEIDIVGASRGRYDLLGSCKWGQEAPTAALGQLLSHRDSLPRAGSARLAIFARGFEPELERRAKEEQVSLVTAERLFR
ncbi:MAG TPA: ATP-binding protein [Solirubrobacterales bacterium]|nr:ATP-binding protein [Solirubrobacterales bacterium]